MDNNENNEKRGGSDFLKQLSDVVNSGDPNKGADAIKRINEIHKISEKLNQSDIMSKHGVDINENVRNRYNKIKELRSEEESELKEEENLIKHIDHCEKSIEMMVTLHNIELTKKIKESESLKSIYKEKYGKDYVEREKRENL